MKHSLIHLFTSMQPMMEAFIPSVANLDLCTKQQMVQQMDDALSRRPQALRSQVVFLVQVLNWLPLLFYGQSFQKLTQEQRLKFLERVHYSPIMKLRIGLWGLRTLVFMAYYSRPEVRSAIGYHPHINGWEARSCK